MIHSQAGDGAVRAQALDPERSFIIQAPAGSGKTELLIQRYLRLLATVDQPEQVVAITFTRKAAAEMRSRVLGALNEAEFTEAVPEGHRARTFALARAVLDRDVSNEWNIRAYPQRMRIGTLDALNAALARQLPVLSGGVAASRVVEDASREYAAAARRAIDELSSSERGRDELSRVLREHDNNLPRLERMIADLLSTREQWLPLIAGKAESLRDTMEASRLALESEQVERLKAVFPQELLRRLSPLLEHAATYAESEPLRKSLSDWCNAELAMKSIGVTGTLWLGIASLLLTEKGTWRKRITKREGFGPTHAALGSTLKEILALLEDHEDVRDSLHGIAALPLDGLGEAELRLLDSLRVMLVQAVAELRVGFSLQRSVDFGELAAAARRALGSVDEPSELLLALDLRIQHILVDEYQDTSRSQIDLLEQLTSGWEPSDGRTLFLVGDPMQSIYRFRHADMSLFMRTRAFGIGDVRMESLALTANFRSSPAIVTWVNDTFADVFPEEDDLEVGVTQFHACEATRDARGEQFVQYHPLDNVDLEHELNAVVALIREERSRSADSSIGILVQSRSHLVGLRAKLRLLTWPVRAVEVDALHTEQFVQDLLALCRGLTHLGDTLAWLAVLRAPWCGLTWADIEALTAGDTSRTVWEMMHDEDALAVLSDDGRGRAVAMREVLTRVLKVRGMYPFAQWIELAWVNLAGPSTLTSVEQHGKVDQFFAGLERAAANGDVNDPTVIEDAFKRPQPETDSADGASIDIMTIHRAKGLEFDTVIISGLNRVPRHDRARALQILERTGENGEAQFLLAPEMRDGYKTAAYIKSIEARRDLAERARLLYVAATRARERLHLIWGIGEQRAEPPRRALLANIWARVRDIAVEPVGAEANHTTPPRTLEPGLRRLVQQRVGAGRGFDVSMPVADEASSVEYAWAGESSAHVGTVVHRYLQTIADSGLSNWTRERIEQLAEVFRAELALLGVHSDDLDGSSKRVVTALVRVLDDPKGRWLLGPHESADSELEITSLNDSRLTHMRLDRTFIDANGIRWIIDFKTGTHEGGQLDAFLDSELERYRPQLDQYARAMSKLETREIRVALYYPLLQAFRDWSPNL